MDRSEGCHSVWGVGWDYQIKDPTYKTSWRIQLGEWKTFASPKDCQTKQYMAWSWWKSKEQKDTSIAEWAEESAKLQAARRDRGIYEVLTGDKDYFLVTADARLKLKKKDTAPAMPCIEKEDSRGEAQAVETSIEASEEQSDSEKTGACWKVKWQHMDRIAEERQVGSFHYVTAAKVLGHHLKASWYGWRNKWRKFSVPSSQNDRSSQMVTNVDGRMSWNLDQSSSTTRTKKVGIILKNRGTSSKKLIWSPSGRPLGRTIVIFEKGWEKMPTWECLYVIKKHGLFSSVFVDEK